MNQSASIVDEAEVVVVGAGPAGSVCAATLAQLGHDVVLIDKDRFPRDKPCGDGLTPSAVSFLKKLDMDDLLDGCLTVEGLQIFYDYSRIEFRPYTSQPGKPQVAKCIPRRSLDEALLNASQARGVRFVNGLVDGPLLIGGRAVGVGLTQDGKDVQIRGKYFVAADGATSRMRSQSEVKQQVYDLRGFAARQYFVTENSLDPVFEFYVPPKFEDKSLVGYGWVFPVEKQLANIGVGYYCGPGLASPPPITQLLDSFVEGLHDRAAGKFGEIERTGKPFGSPVGVNFSSDLCQIENILFIGDAARTTDPLNGEGIVYALQGAEAAATSLHESIKREAPAPEIGLQLNKRFPRLGQDVSVIARTVQRGFDQPKNKQSDLDLFTQSQNPFINSVIRLISSPEENPIVSELPVGLLVEGCDRMCGEMLDDMNQRALTVLRTEFPLAFEMLHREMRSYAGPVYATTLLLSASAAGAEPSDRLISAALSVELLALFMVFASQVVDQDRSSANFNNATAVLLADFAVSRALVSIADLGASTSSAFGRTARSMCEGQMLEIEDLFNVRRTPQRYFRATEAKAGALFAFSARVGAEVAGAEGAVIAHLEHYGRELGTAFQISNDLLDLLEGDEITNKSPGNELRQGNYTLPILHALSKSVKLKQLLEGNSVNDRIEEIVAEIDSARGVDKSIKDCRDHVDAAKRAIEDLPNDQFHPLNALADLAIGQIVDRPEKGYGQAEVRAA